MPIYRLYTLSPRNGHILSFEDFEADDDHSAIERARQGEGRNPLELWQGGRKLHRLEADDPVADKLQYWPARRRPLPWAS